MAGQFALRAPDGATVTLDRFPILLGRTTPGGVIPDVDVSHLDPQEGVDNRHCELYLADGGVEVRDLGGVSGTWVDGQRLRPGGQRVLPVGGSLRVAGVQLTLIPAPGRHLGGEPAVSLTPTVGDWRDSLGSRGVPPPPSSSGAVEDAVPAPRLRSPLDLTGAPATMRAALAGGADAVRMVEGSPLQVRRLGETTAEGEPLSQGVLDDALGAVRRVLGRPEDARSGWGYAGDLEIDFVDRPIASRASLGAVVVSPPDADAGVLERAAAWVEAGGTLLVAGRRPEVVLRLLGAYLVRSGTRPRILASRDSSWASPGWVAISPGSPDGLSVALEGDPLVAVEPQAAELERILACIPRLAGGTILAVEAASPEAALEHCARSSPREWLDSSIPNTAERAAEVVQPPQGGPLRIELARRLRRVVSWASGTVEFQDVSFDPTLGGWVLVPSGA